MLAVDPKLAAIIGPGQQPPLYRGIGAVNVRTSQMAVDPATAVVPRWRLHARSLYRRDTLAIPAWHKHAAEPDATADLAAPTNSLADDHPMAPYSRQADVVAYSAEEYDSLLQHTEWSREETDRLFELCRQFDGRFIVIADRYTDGGAYTPRTIEDLKERYYGVTQTLMQHHNPLPDPDQKAYIARLHYDKAKELRRKEYVQTLIDSRSAADVEREDFLLFSARMLKQRLPDLMRQRRAYTRLLGSDTFGQPTLAQVVAGDSSPEKKRRPRKRAEDAAADSSSSSSRRRKPPASALLPITEEVPSPVVPVVTPVPSATPAPRRERKVAGLIVKTFALPVVKSSSVQQRIVQQLDELGFQGTPAMATDEVRLRFEELYQQVTIAVDMKRQLERLEHETRNLTAQRNVLLGTTPSPVAVTPSTPKRPLSASSTSSVQRAASEVKRPRA